MITGFLATAGSFGLGLALSYRHHPAQDLLVEPAAAPEVEVMEVYYPFPDQIFVRMPGGKIAILSISFFLSGPPMDLLALDCPHRVVRV